MKFKDIDMVAVLRRVADQRIEQAMTEGKFNNLPGAGREIILDDMPTNEEARMKWWCLRILRQNGFTPEEVRWRKEIDSLRAAMATADAVGRSQLIARINELVRRINTLGTNALPSGVAPLAND